ncbi:MAG TPA: hypothetical protein VGF24_09915 [Vicinamibacterales bacterium]
MAPSIAGTAAPGNVGRNFPAITSDVTARTLSIVRERFPEADVAGRPSTARPALAGYASAAGQAVTTGEVNAAVDAATRGATHLLVPTITEWTEMRTDDPIGALIGRHESVTIALRLMRLEPPALVSQVTFHNRARVTLNRKASRLLDERFRREILQLLPVR